MLLQFLRTLTAINGPREMAVRVGGEVRASKHHLTPRKVINLSLAIWEMWSRQTVLLSYPYRFYVEPTNACNLRCPYCFGWQGRSTRRIGFMNLELFKRLIDDIKDYAIWIDLYNRGEPFLNPRIFEMIEYAHANNIATKISSNLNVLDRNDVERVILSGLDHLVIALDGATQESYGRYRVGGDLNVVIENVRHLINARRRVRSMTPFITLRVLVNRYNEREIPDIRRMAAQLGVDNVFFYPMLVNAADSTADDWLPEDPRKSWYEYRTRANRLTSQGRIVCSELWRRGVIHWDGSVFPCCFVEHGNPYGDVHQRSFREIWNDRLFVDSRSVFRRRSVVSEAVCASCQGGLKKR